MQMWDDCLCHAALLSADASLLVASFVGLPGQAVVIANQRGEQPDSELKGTIP